MKHPTCRLNPCFFLSFSPPSSLQVQVGVSLAVLSPSCLGYKGACLLHTNCSFPTELEEMQISVVSIETGICPLSNFPA